MNSIVLSYTTGRGDIKAFEEKGGLYADHSALDIFDLKFVQGYPANALKEVNAVVISESMAKRYFDEENPVGKILKMEETAAALGEENL